MQRSTPQLTGAQAIPILLLQTRTNSVQVCSQPGRKYRQEELRGPAEEDGGGDLHGEVPQVQRVLWGSQKSTTRDEQSHCLCVFTLAQVELLVKRTTSLTLIL